MFGCGIAALLWGGTTRGGIYYGCVGGTILVGLVLALGVEKVFDMVVRVIEWLIDKFTGGGRGK